MELLGELVNLIRENVTVISVLRRLEISGGTLQRPFH